VLVRKRAQNFSLTEDGGRGIRRQAVEKSIYDRECVLSVCVCVRERKEMRLSAFACNRERKRRREREREREREEFVRLRLFA